MKFAGYQVNLTPTAMFLIVMNIIPIIGVFVFGWDTGTLLLLYWLESVVIGILNIPKILSCQGEDKGAAYRRPSLGGKIFLCVFFAVHFGGFSFGHYAFLASFFKSVPPFSELIGDLVSAKGLLFSMLGLFVSHFFSMVRNFYGNGEYKTRSPNTQMFTPYGRVFIMHVVIIFGGAMVQAFGAPVLAILLLIVLKTVIDVTAHMAEHKASELTL